MQAGLKHGHAHAVNVRGRGRVTLKALCAWCCRRVLDGCEVWVPIVPGSCSRLKERSDTTRFFDGTLCTVPQVPLQLGRPNIPPAAPLDARFIIRYTTTTHAVASIGEGCRSSYCYCDSRRDERGQLHRSCSQWVLESCAAVERGALHGSNVAMSKSWLRCEPCCLSCSRTEAIVDVMR